MKNHFKLTLTALAFLVVSNVMAIEYSGLYRLKSRYNRYAQELLPSHVMNTSANLSANDLKQIWIVEKNGTKYTIRNANSGRYIPTDGGADAALVTVSDPTDFYIKTSDNSNEYLTISWNSKFSGATCLHDNRSHNVVKWFANTASNENQYSDWQLVALSASDTITNATIRKHLGEAAGITSQITPGYYRFVSVSSPNYSMAENVSTSATVATQTKDNDYTQIWRLTVNNDTVTIQNAISKNYMRNNVANNIQIRTTPVNENNTFVASLSDLKSGNRLSPSKADTPALPATVALTR